MNNYGEIFCTAVNEIVKNQINSIQYDLTKDCTVISKKKKGEYEYVVSDGSSTFKAFATEGASYNVGDQVLVSIPQGDYSKQKTIVNKIVSDNSDPIGYKNPFELFVAGTPDLIKPQEKGPAGIVANGSTYDLPLAQYTDKNESTCAGFTRIAVAADFMTLLNGMDITKGEYGLKLIIDDGVGHVADYMFSASEMLGNPYAFNTYFRQECVFTLPESILSIKSLTVYLYQDGEFASNNYKITADENVRNIFVNNLEVRLGYEKGHVASELVRLSSSNTQYSFGDQERECFLQWMHLNSDETFSPINNLTWNNYKDHCEIRWYQYTPGCSEQDTDKYGGENWKWLNVSDAPQLENPFQNTIVLSDNKEYEKVKVVVLYKSHPLNNNPNYEHIDNYTSNILEFTNTTESSAGGTQADSQVAADLSLYFEDGSYGNYYRYDQNSQLIDASTEGPTKIRTVKLRAKNADLDGHWEHYNNIDWIRWEVPNGNSMIIPDKAGNTNFVNPEDNLFNIQGFGGEGIVYSQTGDFTFKADFSVPTNNPKNIHYVKVVLSTLNSDNLWDAPNNRPIASHFITVNESSQAATVNFKISRAYSKLKLNLLTYDENRIEITSFDLDSDIFITNAELKNTSKFLIATVDKDNANMTYAIQSAWMRSRDNNNIRCIVSVNGVQHEVTETLSFGLKGSNGTSTTLILEMLNNKNSLKLNDNDGLSIQAMMVGNYGQPIDFDKDGSGKPKIEWRLLNNDNSYMVFADNNITASGTNIVTIKGTSNLTTVPDDNYTILEVKYQPSTQDSSGYNPCLHTYLPIPISSVDCYGMQGATQILYNSQGVPKLSDNLYIAFYEENNEKKENNEWKLTQPTEDINPNKASLVTVKEGETIKGSVLHAAPLYSKKATNITNVIQDKMCVSCEGKWSQPILVMQSQYDYAMLNGWNGELAIDYEGGTILSTMLGAGKKNAQNQFSGVLIGDIRGGSDNTTNAPNETGVYGFRDGVMTYGLKESGTAFFGAEGRGRIEFDGEESVIKSTGWTKENNEWTNSQSGSLLDLDDAILLMQTKNSDGSDGNYLKFNNNDSGALEMSLSGANIKLSDKDNSSVTSYIDISSQGIVSEVRRSANYYGICNTTSYDNNNFDTAVDHTTNDQRIKKAKIDLDVGNDIADKKYGVHKISIDDIFKTGTTIAITFQHGQQVAITLTDKNETVSGTTASMLTEREIERQGHILFLNLCANDNPNKTVTKPIYFNGDITGPLSTNLYNSFGWESGATIWFTYNATTKYTDKMNNEWQGAWHVVDSGAYSNITQTADFIRTEVASEIGNAATSIQQTANSIRSEARRYSGYVGTCETTNGTDDLVKIVRVTNLPTADADFSIQSDLLQKGVGLAVTFTHKDRLNTLPDSINQRELKIKCAIDTDNPGANEMTREVIIAAEGSQFSWEAGSTVYFVYNGTNWVVSDAGNYSRITQTANAITSEVRRTATYHGTCNTENSLINSNNVQSFDSSKSIKEVELTNILKGYINTAEDENPQNAHITAEDLYQNGVTIAVTFNNAQGIIQTTSENDVSATEGTTNTYTYKEITRETQGDALKLKITNFTSNNEHPIYINGYSTGIYTINGVNHNNPFGWSAGSVVYFTYDTSLNNGNGAWKVSDSGSYSNITQTADSITSEVRTLDNKQSSKIVQTATEIRSEVEDKEKGLTTKITQTANSIVSEARRRATYYGRSQSAIANSAQIRYDVSISNDSWINNSNTTEDGDITSNITASSLEITASDLYQTGVTIGVKFESAEVPQRTEAINGDVTTYTTTGKTIKLDILEKTFPVYANGKITGPQSDNSNNPFGWEANDIIYFMFTNTSKVQGGIDGYWSVTNAGSYSKIIQTADRIESTVSEHGSKSFIRQTAKSIASEVRKFAGYSCHTDDTFNTAHKAILDVDIAAFSNLSEQPTILQNGTSIALTFNYDLNQDNYEESLGLYYSNGTSSIGDPAPIYYKGAQVNSDNPFTCSAGHTVQFIYTVEEYTQEGNKVIKNYWKVSDGGSYSRITQTANDITSEVRRTATYYGICETPNTEPDLSSQFQNIQKSVVLQNATGVTNDEICQKGVTIAVTFKEAQTVQETINDDGTVSRIGYNLYLSVNQSSPVPIYLNGNQVNNQSNTFGWYANSVIYFTYDIVDGSSRWVVTDSGSYSKITQTADLIRSEVKAVDGRVASVEVTVDAITSRVSELDPYKGIVLTIRPLDNENISSTSTLFPVKLEDNAVESLKDGLTILVKFPMGIKQSEDRIQKLIVYKANGTAILDGYVNHQGHPIYYKDKSGNECKGLFTCGAGASVIFKYNQNKENTGISEVPSTGAWEVVDNAYSQIQQTANNIGAEVISKKGIDAVGFKWELTDERFKLSSVKNGTATPVFDCSEAGLTITPKTFVLDTGTFKINSTGSPAYLQVIHNQTDVLKITTNSFEMRSVPRNALKDQQVYYVIAAWKDGSNVRNGGFNEQQTAISWVDSTGTTPVANYPLGSYIPVTTEKPYRYRSSELWYQTIDGYFICCRGSSDDDGNAYLYLRTKVSGGTNVKPGEWCTPSPSADSYKAYSGKWDISVDKENMLIDVQSGQITIGSNSMKGSNCRDESGNLINGEFKTASAEQKTMYMGLDQQTPLKIGNFEVDWSGKIGCNQKWNISHDGGASFGWLWSSRINCTNLKCTNTIDGTAEYVVIKDHGQATTDKVVLVSGGRLRKTSKSLDDIIKDRIEYFVKAEALKN